MKQTTPYSYTVKCKGNKYDYNQSEIIIHL